jgi:Glycosyltransferase sugar-binding region containing DXD motif
MFWVGEHLPSAHAACVASFLDVGHPIELFAYGPVANVPTGVTLCPAEDIMPASAVYRYGPAAGASAGGLSGSAKLFRYRLLHEVGGYYADTDVYCLRALPDDDIVIAGERTKTGETIAANCVMKLPPGHELARRCRDVCLASDSQSLAFGDTGPRLVGRVLRELGLESCISPADMFCPRDWFDYQAVGDRERLDNVPMNCRAVHLWNEMWRQNGKSVPVPSRSPRLA